MSVVFSFKSREPGDVCQFVSSSEQDYGVQCVIVKDVHNAKDYTAQHLNVAKTIASGKPCKDIVFIHIAMPGKAFEPFDMEKNKLIIPVKAYFKLLEFFQNEAEAVLNRLEAEASAMQTKKTWITVEPGLSFRGIADVIATLQLDSGSSYSLDLVLTRRLDLNITQVVLGYSDHTLGLVGLPIPPMMQLASRHSAVHKYYKETVSSKKSRQS